jgi:hypothetical protein
MTMTQRGAGSFGPRTLPGGIVTVLWMIGSTIKHLQGAVHGSGDLSAVRVGAVVGASTESTLSRMQIKYRKFSSPQDGSRRPPLFRTGMELCGWSAICLPWGLAAGISRAGWLREVFW